MRIRINTFKNRDKFFLNHIFNSELLCAIIFCEILNKYVSPFFLLKIDNLFGSTTLASGQATRYLSFRNTQVTQQAVGPRSCDKATLSR